MRTGWAKQKTVLVRYLLMHIFVLCSLLFIVLFHLGYSVAENEKLSEEEEVDKKVKDIKIMLEDLEIKEIGGNSTISQCLKLGDAEPLALQSDGDVVIGGFFPLHYVASEPLHSYHSKPLIIPCSGFDYRAFRWMMTMVFAVEEINNNSDLLPGVKLGYRIMDSCDNIYTSLHALFSLVSFSKNATNVINQTTEIENTKNLFIERDFGSDVLNSTEMSNISNLVTTVKMKIGDPITSVSYNTADIRYFMQDNKTEELSTTQFESTMCLSGSPVSAVIGFASSSPTRAAAQILGSFSIPLVSYFATCTCLSDKLTYPSFLRTVPSDLFQVNGLVQLVTFFGWLWVGTIGTTDDYSHYGIQAFSNQFKSQGGCVAFHLTIPASPTASEIQEMANLLQNSTTRVVVVFATEGQLLDLFVELAQRNVTGIQWIASEAWVTASLLTLLHFHHLLEGTLGFSFPGVRIPGLKEFLLKVRPSPKAGMEFINMFWEEQFGCKLRFEENIPRENETRNINDVRPVCTGSEDLSLTVSSYTDVSQVRISYNVYKAVYAIAHALHTLLSCDSAGIDGETCDKQKQFTSEQLLYHLKAVNFTTQFEEKVYFDSNGEPVPLYDIINWQRSSNNKIRFVKVGNYDGSTLLGQQLQIKQNSIIWTGGESKVPTSQCSAPCPPGSRQARRPGEPRCCFDCLPCADGEISNQTGSTECIKCPEFFWSDKDKVKCIAGVEDFLSFNETMGIILVALTLLGVILTVMTIAIFYHFRTTPIVKANNSEISFLLLLSIKLCFLCSLMFIGQPSVWTCMLRQAAFGISFVICLSCLLVKTIVVLLAFRANVPGPKGLKMFGPSQQRSMIFCTTAPQIFLCIGWLLGAPPFPFRNPTYRGSNGKIIVECKEPWPLGFYVVLCYIGLLAFFCLLLAFLGRKLPDTFNEAKFITFSMLIFIAVWISFIPAYVSSPGKFSVAVEIFAILASSFGLLLCIFVPKCYIILLHPEKNVKKCMTGRFNK